MEKCVLSLDNVSKFYTSARNVVVGLNSVSLNFHRGEFVAITGESGSGKSTLAHVVAGILPYESGEMLFDGRPTSHFDAKDWERHRRDKISFISQSYGILLSASVMENVVSALRLSGMEKKDARREAKAILQKVELWDLRKRRAAKLSSGQKQRLSIARALAKPAPILIADEPTGNLDPENSAKVIRLLAEAAKDRLVLLITHDFFEAEDCATRRISLKDGKVVMDAPLRPASTPEPLPAPRKTKKQFLSPYVSRLQLAGRPVWCSFVLLFFTLTAFAVFAFLGTFITALDDTNTRIYSDRAFKNGDPLRIVVQRADGAYLTEEDHDAIVNTKYVTSLEKHGFIKDITCLYLKDEHYRTAFTLVNVGSPVDPVYEEWIELKPLRYDVFAQTVPVMPEGEEFLTAGRLPENVYEAVMAGDESLIGQTMTVYLLDEPHWALNKYICYDVTIVGVTDYGEGLYLHDDIGRIFSHNNPWDNRGVMAVPSADIAPGTMKISLSAGIKNPLGQIWGFPTTDGDMVRLECAGFHLMNWSLTMTVSQEDFDRITPAQGGTQASVTISNYAYASRVMTALQKMGYIALSPYRLGATFQDPDLANQRIQTLVICAAALVLVVVLQIIVLRALFGSQMENYKLLANIGLPCATAKRSLLEQILLFTALGQLLGAAALWYCHQKGVERIVSIIRYLPGKLMVLLSGVHIAAALIAAMWLGRVIRRRVYPESARKDDIFIDDEEVAV